MNVLKEGNIPPTTKHAYEFLGRSFPPKEAKPLVDPLIRYKNTNLITDLVQQRFHSSGMVVILVAGVRGSGKTEVAPKLASIAEDLFARKPTQNAIFSIDAALHERRSPLRTLAHRLEEYYRWDTLQAMLHSIVTAMRGGQTEVRLQERYLRSLGTTRSTTHPEHPWSLRIFFHQPVPVLVVEGTFALHPDVTKVFRDVTEPITVMLYTDSIEQLKRVLLRKPESRSVEEENQLNTHDVIAWNEHRRRYGLDHRAELYAWSYYGEVTFNRNPLR